MPDRLRGKSLRPASVRTTTAKEAVQAKGPDRIPRGQAQTSCTRPVRDVCWFEWSWLVWTLQSDGMPSGPSRKALNTVAARWSPTVQTGRSCDGSACVPHTRPRRVRSQVDRAGSRAVGETALRSKALRLPGPGGWSGRPPETGDPGCRGSRQHGRGRPDRDVPEPAHLVADRDHGGRADHDSEHRG